MSRLDGRRRGHGEEDLADEEIIGLVLAGERQQYSVLVRRYQDALFRFAAGMIADPDAAADLVQDTLVKAYSHLDRCRDPGRFRVWLFQILRNRCLDHLRSGRRRDVPLEERPDLPAGGEGPERRLERGELRSQLEAALARLPDAQREAFLLKHVQDLSYEEMAAMLDASVGALKMRVMRARETLQDLLQETAGYGPRAL